MSIIDLQTSPEKTPILREQSIPSEVSHIKPWSWKPTSLKIPTLLGALIFSAALLATVSILHYVDKQDGALLFANPGNTFSTKQVFLYRYLPIILLVTFGLLVTQIDLDLRRLEPWYQLSSTCNVNSGPALLCRYDTAFVGNVIVSAMRRGHRPVFCSAVLTILATMVVPAIQNSMFATQTRKQNSTVSIAAHPQLLSLDEQTSALTSNFLMTAYGVIWLGQAQPPFTTDASALGDFTIPESGGEGSNITLTSETTRYWTEINCWPPAAVESNMTTNWTSFDDGRGCLATNMITFDPDLITPGFYEGNYFGAQNRGGREGSDRRNLLGPCPQSPHLILLTWRKVLQEYAPPDFSPSGNAVALFCEPSYYMQRVNATVMVPNGTVVEIHSYGDKSNLTDDLFNRTNFETILANGQSLFYDTLDNATQLTIDIADAYPVAQNLRLSAARLYTTSTFSSAAMVGFALGIARGQPESLLNVGKLQETFTKAQTLAFSLGMRQNFGTTLASRQVGALSSARDSVHIVPAFAFATESLLLLVVALCAIVMWELRGRSLQLSRDPDSLAELMSLCRSTKLQEMLLDSNNEPEEQLSDRLTNAKIDIKQTSTFEAVLELSRLPEGKGDDADKPGQTPEGRKNGNYPLEISSLGLRLSIIILTITIAVLLVTGLWSDHTNGLRPPQGSQVTSQILLNFLPTAFATLLSVYVTLVCRVHSFLTPLENLRHGNASPSSSLGATYTSWLPQLIFLESLSLRHYLVTALSLVSLLSHTLLTVTMASLFSLQDAPMSEPIAVQAMYRPNVRVPSLETDKFTNGYIVDSIYTTVANLSESATLPEWTTKDYAFLPVNLSAEISQPGLPEIEFETTGYGSELQCIDLLSPTATVSAKLEFKALRDTWLMRLWANYTQPDGEVRSCWFLHKLLSPDGFGQLFYDPSSETSAFEISNRMEGYNTSDIPEADFCENQIVKGWVRAKVSATNTPNGSVSYELDHNATVLSCSHRLRSRPYLLRVTKQGSILSATPTGPVNYNIPPTVNLTHTLNAINKISTDQYDQPAFHKDTVARDWSNYVYKKMLNSTDLLDAGMPQPTFEDARRFMSDAFSRLFAVQLSFDSQYLVPLNITAKSLSNRDNANSTEEPPEYYTLPARAYYTTRRIFISKPNFIISMIILLLDLVVLSIFSFHLSKPFLPKMPFTIASQIAYFAGSHAVEDVVQAGGNCRVLDAKGYKYGYGRYIGKDRLEHVGIERMEFIIPEKDAKGKRDMKRGSGKVWWASLWKKRQPTVKGSIKLRPRGFESIPGHDRSESEESAKSLRGDNWI